MVPISESSSRQFLAAVRTISSAGSTLMLSGKKNTSDGCCSAVCVDFSRPEYVPTFV